MPSLLLTQQVVFAQLNWRLTHSSSPHSGLLLHWAARDQAIFAGNAPTDRNLKMAAESHGRSSLRTPSCSTTLALYLGPARLLRSMHGLSLPAHGSEDTSLRRKEGCWHQFYVRRSTADRGAGSQVASGFAQQRSPSPCSAIMYSAGVNPMVLWLLWINA